MADKVKVYCLEYQQHVMNIMDSAVFHRAAVENRYQEL